MGDVWMGVVATVDEAACTEGGLASVIRAGQRSAAIMVDKRL